MGPKNERKGVQINLTVVELRREERSLKTNGWFGTPKIGLVHQWLVWYTNGWFGTPMVSLVHQ